MVGIDKVAEGTMVADTFKRASKDTGESFDTFKLMNDYKGSRDVPTAIEKAAARIKVRHMI